METQQEIDPQTGLPHGYEPPAPSRDDTRYPRRRERSVPTGESTKRFRSHLGPLITLAIVLISFAVQALSGGGDSEPADQPQPPQPAAVRDDPAVRAYLDEAERLCQGMLLKLHDNQPVAEIVQAEAELTSRITALPAPAGATEIRQDLIRAQRAVDAIALRLYHVMSRSEHPSRVYHRLMPEIGLKVSRMGQTFASYGMRCNAGGS